MYEWFPLTTEPETVHHDDRFGYRITILDTNGREFVAPIEKLDYETFKSVANAVQEFVDNVETMMREGDWENVIRVGHWRIRGDMIAGVCMEPLLFEKVNTP